MRIVDESKVLWDKLRVGFTRAQTACRELGLLG